MGRRTAGEGGYHTTRRGYRVVEIELPRGSDGKRRRKRIYAKTAAELQEKRKQYELEQGLGLHAELDRLTLEQLLHAWLEHGVKVKNRTNTYESSYEPIVRLHLIPNLGKHKVVKLKTVHIQAMINGLKTDYAPRTLRNIKAVLRKALNQAKVWYGLKENVADAVEVPAAKKPKYRTLNQDEAQAFLDALSSHRLEALYWVAILMGLRVGELIGLPLDALDLEAGTMRVRVQIQRLKGKRDETTPTKGGNDELLAIPTVLIPILRAHLERLREEATWDRWVECGLVFPSDDGKPLHATYVYKEFKRALERAGIDPKGIRLHDLRHTCASLLIAQGVHLSVVKERMRHSQISITADTYGHVFEEAQRTAAEKIGSLFVAPEPVTLELPRRKEKARK